MIFECGDVVVGWVEEMRVGMNHLGVEERKDRDEQKRGEKEQDGYVVMRKKDNY